MICLSLHIYSIIWLHKQLLEQHLKRIIMCFRIHLGSQLLKSRSIQKGIREILHQTDYQEQVVFMTHRFSMYPRNQFSKKMKKGLITIILVMWDLVRMMVKGIKVRIKSNNRDSHLAMGNKAWTLVASKDLVSTISKVSLILKRNREEKEVKLII
jgi:hypothetical protein